MTDLAKLVVRLEAQTAQYMAQLDKANKRLEKFDKQASASASGIAKGVATAVAAATTAFAAMAKQTVDNADKLSKLSQVTGLSTESLSQLQYVADQSATSIDEIAKSMARLQRTQLNAARGLATATRAFDAIGVSVTNADGSLRDTEEVMLDVADRFEKIEDGAAKAAIAQELFGRSGTNLIPFLNQGRAGIEALKKEADDFGLTVTSKAGKAAELFNDNLTRINAATRGLVNRVSEQLIPVFVAMSDRFVASAKSGGALDAAVKALSTTLKFLVSTGVAVTSVFEQLGRIIYGVGASIVSLAKGDFKIAADEIKSAFAEARSNVTDDIETIAKIWSDTVPQIEESAAKMGDALKETLIFDDETAKDKAQKAADAALEQIKKLEQGLRQQVETYGMGEGAVIRYRLAQGDLADEVARAGKAAGPYVEQIIRMTDELERLRKETEESEALQREWVAAVEEGRRITEQMRTPAEVYADTIERLNELLAEGHIIQETYNRAVEAAQETFDKATREQNKFLEEANRNVQNILAQGLEDALDGGIKKGAKGALQAFSDMLKKMMMQALAADIGKWLFGGEGMGSGGGRSGGRFGAALGALFGGSRDEGGRGRRGRAYMIGTGAQPELFVPDTSGTFIPAGEWMGRSQKVTQNIYVQGRVDQRSARQLELEAMRRQNAAASRLG